MGEFKDIASLIRDYFAKSSKKYKTDNKDMAILELQLKNIKLEKKIKQLEIKNGKFKNIKN